MNSCRIDRIPKVLRRAVAWVPLKWDNDRLRALSLTINDDSLGALLNQSSIPVECPCNLLCERNVRPCGKDVDRVDTLAEFESRPTPVRFHSNGACRRFGNQHEVEANVMSDKRQGCHLPCVP